MAAKQTSIIILSFCIAICMLNSCTKKPAAGLDLQLYQMAKDTIGFVWFRHSDSLLNKSEGSTHSQPLIRTRFNSIAASKLDSNGMIIPGSVFPDGSLIVKEMFDKSRTLKTYTTLYKDPTNKIADEKGWIWGAVGADGTVEITAYKKGSACIDCHLQPDNIDYMLMNKFYP